MNIKTLALICACTLVSSVCMAADYNSKDGNISIAAPVIEYATRKITASGGVHIDANDPVQKSKLVVDAKTVTVTLGSTPGVKADSTVSMIKNAKMQGPLTMVFTSIDENGIKTKSTASSDRGEYDGVEGMVYLVGNVKITNENPALFSAPTIATGDKATINLHPAKEGDSKFRFRIESDPGYSRVEMTPKQETKSTK